MNEPSRVFKMTAGKRKYCNLSEAPGLCYTSDAMKKKFASATAVIIALAILLYAAMGRIYAASAPAKMEEFADQEYGYAFQYPAGWVIRRLPEGVANKDVRVKLQGPNGSSFTVIVDRTDKRLNKEEWLGNAKRKEVVEKMIADTVEQVYKSISRNLGAVDMTIGEQHDLSNDLAVKFYIATRHAIAGKSPVIVAGIHTFPFGKDYALNFLMTAFQDKTTEAGMTELTFVFNSFHLIGEPSAIETKSHGAAKKP